jgi:hypothetical protein
MKKKFVFTCSFRLISAELLKTSPSEQHKHNFVGEISTLKNNVFNPKLSKVIIGSVLFVLRDFDLLSLLQL